MEKKISIALDVGNSGAKVLAATMDDGYIEILDERVIPNETVEINGVAYWDLFRLFRDLKEAMRQYAKLGTVVSIAVDSTVAYAFVNRKGVLQSYLTSMIQNRSDDWKIFTEKKMTLRQLYDRTGVYPISFNVLSRLTAEYGGGILSRDMDAFFAPIPALFEFMLTGGLSAEHSIAGATVLMDPQFRDWNRPLMRELGIPDSTMPPIAAPGTIAGKLLPQVAEETNCPECRFIHTVEFDSATAMISAPGFDRDQIYLSMGTTINPGVELEKPVISDDAWRYRYKNAPLWPGSVMLMSDVPGFHLVESCLKEWRKKDPDLGHGELIQMAEKARCDTVLDLFDARFYTGGDQMLSRIRSFCEETGQEVPQTVGQTAHVLYQSYASAIAWSIGKLKTITGRDDYQTVIAVSGGSRNALLCQMIADASSMPVKAGDPKATCLGNLLVQFYALGNLKDRDAMRREAERICPMKIYLPKNN